MVTTRRGSAKTEAAAEGEPVAPASTAATASKATEAAKKGGKGRKGRAAPAEDAQAAIAAARADAATATAEAAEKAAEAVTRGKSAAAAAAVEEELAEPAAAEQQEPAVGAAGQEPTTPAKGKSAQKKGRTPTTKPRAPGTAEQQKRTTSAEHKKFDYEFMGPPGAAFIMLSLPLTVLGLYYACAGDFCADNAYLATMPDRLRAAAEDPAAAGEWLREAARHAGHTALALLTPEAGAVFLGWMLVQVLLERFLFATIALGTPLADGSRLPYRINGHLAFWVSFLLMGHALPNFKTENGNFNFEDRNFNFIGFRAFPLAWLYDHYAELAAWACSFSAVLSAVLFLAAQRPGTVLAKPGSSGVAVYDMFMGRELNPRIFNFDLKYFCELRPGLIGWAALNLGCAAKMRALTGGISPGMALVCFGQGMYVWDALYNEQSILTTMDITSDGFGYMLAFGDLAWVPFTYSLQARYLVEHDPRLPWPFYAFCLALHCAGYSLFRLANAQKDAFRRDPTAPEVAHLKFMQTKRGTKLLVSGWWGMARKINYTGDWLMALSWCLCCGFDSPLPYFYCVYFGVLLVHRAFRDDHACAAKYGDDWKAYKARVPSMFIPYVV